MKHSPLLVHNECTTKAGLIKATSLITLFLEKSFDSLGYPDHGVYSYCAGLSPAQKMMIGDLIFIRYLNVPNG